MSDQSNLPVTIPSNGVDTYRMSTDAAGLCGAIVKQTAQAIQGKKYVRVEGWQAIAIAHGCVASSRDVVKIEGGISAVGEVRRMSDGVVIATAEGFVGDDENTWSKRPMHARRAMAQTRSISRVCRSAFAHVVVMIDASLQTTPAEEMMVLEHEPVKSSSPRDFVSEALADGLVKNGDTRSTHEQTYVPVSQRVADRKAVALLNQTALLAIGTSSNRMELKAWWAENKPVLRKQLPEEDYLAVIAAVEARRDDLPAVEG